MKQILFAIFAKLSSAGIVFWLAIAASIAFAANVGIAPYGLSRFDQASVTRVGDALVDACKHPDDASKWVANCRVEFSWLVTFSASPNVDVNNAVSLTNYVLSRLPADAILTVTTSIGFHSNEGFRCSDLTSSSRNTANQLDNNESFCRKKDKNGKCLPGEAFTIPSYKTRTNGVTQMIRSIYTTAETTYVVGVPSPQDRRGMLRFIIIPHLEDQCSAVQYGYLRDWFDDRVPSAFADMAKKPSIRYRRSPNGDWPVHHPDKTSSPRVTGNALELHGKLGEKVDRKNLPDTTVKGLLGNGDSYNPDGACINWGNKTVLDEAKGEFSNGVSILYWQPQMNGRSDCTTSPQYPQYDVRRVIREGFPDEHRKEFLGAVRRIRDGK